jgi:hypothetical protein
MTLSLNFSTHVLGKEASEQLKSRKVLQTIRSAKESAKFLTKRGSEVSIFLDGRFLYNARITEITRIHSLTEFTQFDAELGGFTHLFDLTLALKRAGFRFKPLPDYHNAYRIQFQPSSF